MNHIKTLNGYKIKFIDKDCSRFEDEPILMPKEKIFMIDVDNYVIGQKGVWFAKPRGVVDMFEVAYASCDEGRTWYRCYKKAKSPHHTAGSRTQAGKILFRTSPRFPLGEVSMGRDVLTWYSNNKVHNSLDGLEIDHKDGDYTNDKLTNLEQVHPRENLRRMREHLARKRGIR